jgi:hypothetical protein
MERPWKTGLCTHRTRYRLPLYEYQQNSTNVSYGVSASQGAGDLPHCRSQGAVSTICVDKRNTRHYSCETTTRGMPGMRQRDGNPAFSRFSSASRRATHRLRYERIGAEMSKKYGAPGWRRTDAWLHLIFNILSPLLHKHIFLSLQSLQFLFVMISTSEKGTENTNRVETVVDSTHIEEASSGELNTIDKTETNQETASIGFTVAEQKRIIRKVDWRVVPLLTFLYLVSFIDRSNS